MINNRTKAPIPPTEDGLPRVVMMRCANHTSPEHLKVLAAKEECDESTKSNYVLLFFFCPKCQRVPAGIGILPEDWKKLVTGQVAVTVEDAWRTMTKKSK